MTNLYRSEAAIAREHRNPITPAGFVSTPLFLGWGPKI